MRPRAGFSGIKVGVALAAGLVALLASAPSWAEARGARAGTQAAVPQPHQVQSRSGPLKQARTSLVAFQTAPFPYRGNVPGTGKPFLNIEQDGRRGHSTPMAASTGKTRLTATTASSFTSPKGSTSAARRS